MKRTLIFFVRFLIAAPICLVLGWLLSPPYIWVVGQCAGSIWRFLLHAPVEAMHVKSQGILNTGSLLVYVVSGHERELPIVPLVTNLPSYIALVMATVGLTIKRRLVITGLGSANLFVSHIVYVVNVASYGPFLEKWPQVPEMLIM